MQPEADEQRRFNKAATFFVNEGIKSSVTEIFPDESIDLALARARCHIGASGFARVLGL